MKTTLQIPNLTCPGCTCGHCASDLMESLRAHKAINSVHADYVEKVVKIDYQPSLKEDALIMFIKSQNYEVEPHENDKA